MTKRFRVLLMLLCDMLAMLLTILGVALAYRLFHGQYSMDIYFKLWPACIIFVGLNEIAKLYQGSIFLPGVTFGPPEELRRLFYSISAVFLFILAFIFMARAGEAYSRFVLFSAWAISLFLVPMARWGLRSLLKPSKLGEIPAVILGAGLAGQKTAHLLNKSKYLGLNAIAFLDDDPSIQGRCFNGAEVIGPLSKAKELLDSKQAEFAIICLPPQAIRPAMEGPCREYPQILIIPDNSTFSSVWTYTYDIGGMLGLELRRTLLLKHSRILKSSVDIALSAVALIVASPIMIFIASLVKLTSRGPALYSATRIGAAGKDIKVFKFRTMYLDADKELERVLEENPKMKEEWNKNFKLKNDPRVTPLGKFLRKTSLDELPQLLNVLRGEMSLIGPRPIVRAEMPFFGNALDTILQVKPGITGLWQVSGRTDTSYAERVDLDIYYIMNWNIWLDIFILLKTVKEVLFCRGAY